MQKNILLLSLLFISSQCFSQDLSAGLQAYYPFNGNANDMSGNNNNPVYNNAILTSDNAGNANSAYRFNGSDTYMQIPNSPSLNMGDQMSIALKVRPLGFYTGQCYNNMMLMKGDGDYLPGNYFVRFSDVVTGCISPTTAGEQFYGQNTVAPTPLVQLNQWYNVVWTADGITAKIYVDCDLKLSVPQTFTNFTNFYDLFIGKMNDLQYPYWLNGDLDEIRIYNRALTQDEVDLYGNCMVMPVNIVSFNAAVINERQIQLNWKTGAESNISGYTIERSAAGTDFVAIGNVPAKNTGISNSYSFTDNSAKPNNQYYYRLAINENGLPKKYSETRSARINNKAFYSLVYPNPTNQFIKVNIFNAAGYIKVDVLNGLGQTIASKKEMGLNTNEASLDISNVPAGSYWVRIQSGQNISIEKIIKQ